MGDVAGTSLQDRYAAVERLYGQGQWSQVLDASAALLAELPDEPGDPLRIRLTLLQGHTQLYGLGQVDAAAALYQQVLDSQPEPLLQSIAQQELERCRQHQVAQAVSPVQPAADPAATRQDASDNTNTFPFSPQPIGSAGAAQQGSAMPWLEQLGGIDAAASPAQAPIDAGQLFSAIVANTTADSKPKPEPEPLAPAAEPVQAAETVLEPETVLAPEAVLTAETVLVPEMAAAAVIADVIDEPDQIDVHQADPARCETVDLTPLASGGRDHDPKPSSVATPVWTPEQEAEWAKGLLRVVLR